MRPWKLAVGYETCSNYIPVTRLGILKLRDHCGRSDHYWPNSHHLLSHIQWKNILPNSIDLGLTGYSQWDVGKSVIVPVPSLIFQKHHVFQKYHTFPLLTSTAEKNMCQVTRMRYVEGHTHPTSRLKDTTPSWVQIGWMNHTGPAALWVWEYAYCCMALRFGGGCYGGKGPMHSGWVTVTSIMPLCIICTAPASVPLTFIFSYTYSPL